MGIIFSNSDNNENVEIKEDKGEGLYSKVSTDRSKIVMPEESVEKLVQTYSNHYYLPVSGRAEMWSLFNMALGSSFPDLDIIFPTLWEIFSKNELCKTQEVLVCLALISNATQWRTKLSHVFDIFKSTCTNEIFLEDIMLGLEVVLQSLLKLWGTELKVETNRDDIHAMSEEIAIAAFDKVGRNADDGMCREDFLMWATERFKQSKNVANEEALLRIYRTQ